MNTKTLHSTPIDNCQKCGEPTHKDINSYRNNPERKLRIFHKCRCKRENEKRRMEAEARRIEKESQAEIDGHIKKFCDFCPDANFESSTFENWRHNPDNEEYYELGIDYCEKWEEMYEKNQGFLFLGTPGTGKSFLAAAIANRLLAAGIPVIFTSFANILEILREGYSAGDSEITDREVLKTLNQAELLILDGLGVENKTDWSYEKLFRIIDNRYRLKKPLIITTDLKFDELRQSLKIINSKSGEIDTGERIFDRIYKMCIRIVMKGKSFRILSGNENQKAFFKD